MNLDEKLPDIAVNFHEGLPSEGFFNKLESRSLVIIDDLYEVRKYKIILLKFMKFFRKQLTMMPFQGLSEWTADTLVSVFVLSPNPSTKKANEQNQSGIILKFLYFSGS